MSSRTQARTALRRTRSPILPGLVVACVALLGVLGCQTLAGSSSSEAFTAPAEPPTHRPHERVPGGAPVAPDEDDGVVPDGVTVFDDGYRAVAKLDRALLAALRRAATDAAGEGVVFFVDSGWRSAQYQRHLLDEAISKYGSQREAARWVASPDTSAHVSGDAVDIGPAAAAAWLAEQGGEYGLCQIYRNEPWHFELRPDAAEHGCPRMYADPTHDPRMRP